MRVFVTGGTGAIGIHTVPALIAAGHTVTALARSETKAAALQAQGAMPISVSLFDRAGLTAALADHDAVVNLASSLPSTTAFILKSAWSECERVRTEGSATVVDAARDAGIQKLIQESVSMIYRDGGADWISEDHPVDHYPITRGNHAAEASAHRFVGDATILRFGVFYGPHATHSEQLLDMAKWHIGFVPGRSDTYLSSIHVVDGAAAVVAALAAPGGTYNIVDDTPLTKREYAQACAAAVGRRIWFNAPGRLGLLLGDRLTSMTRSLRVSNKHFRDACDWSPRYPSAAEGYRALAQLR
ncbi:NAD(P)-dependent oxidoreductase [Mycobacterium sp. CBMA293]|uniref:NAD-dependent epimerase/dehydratase family protein n=1 Tax=unclassified Mycolicibacterium TaxID=2636767 RepID=UPI0012DF4BAA|nr:MULTISPECIES: NAD(P)-dependent oxidoreductase [unclassified Mycolicibacterium]MUL46111.1 NAD(P)-dependent oxidoreductase [Mycolicibacterium sp. CBMA 360]MUL58840.1 NAD(P)-dependent oxidoreductase [Mycolicibacterium sp. CBMA 335]MUL69234.1 NAD(P)-dependent oxidoreductase [Mycolicibacterium sp. CBMA 311]MUL94198.1 NAD(P)-dependent oxidoreductase [Mycolicibacterium sp. CBMA 230]MUM05213.1 epimerase [Mycolicibacterium sp. CBMA 213]